MRRKGVRHVRFNNYYLKIVLASLMLLLFLTLLQGVIYFVFSQNQFRGYVSELASKTLADTHQNITRYFDTLDTDLDSVYQEPAFLAQLNTPGVLRSENPARQLLQAGNTFRN